MADETNTTMGEGLKSKRTLPPLETAPVVADQAKMKAETKPPETAPEEKSEEVDELAEANRKMALASGVFTGLMCCILLLSILLVVTFDQCVAGEDDDAHATDSHQLSWSYHATDNVVGPEQWSSVYASCGGVSQSPINVDISIVEADYVERNMELIKSSGNCTRFFGEETYSTWSVSKLGECTDGKLKLLWDGTEFILNRFHLHSPSEHRLSDKHHDAEVQFVYETPAGGIGPIISVFVEASESEDNSFLAEYWSKFTGEYHSVVGSIDPYIDFIPTSSQVVWYNGSYTTPECTETVPRIICTQTQTMSYHQLNLFKQALGRLPQTSAALANNRPIQPHNNRQLFIVS
ncbi:hypothetical protein CYMTET_25926 [Cymbomonas tetramitiformis]|uniref:carbonic anhydrase n=1 Tax=Cymbomonas tetramitiformis TaxID=36881 RepID=A0AAE0KYP2_9CHLO|nr:hypothetical protein CYMTET_25926 [Cymbomonas tetramitiformis]|eukprot:gene4134-5112_t